MLSLWMISNGTFNDRLWLATCIKVLSSGNICSLLVMKKNMFLFILFYVIFIVISKLAFLTIKMLRVIPTSICFCYILIWKENHLIPETKKYFRLSSSIDPPYAITEHVFEEAGGRLWLAWCWGCCTPCVYTIYLSLNLRYLKFCHGSNNYTFQLLLKLSRCALYPKGYSEPC